jgi:polysaccharide deacetylase family protein (PEP-CTERM system associated)
MWEDCESTVERNTMRILEILEARKVGATFFVLGWVAERFPEMIRAIAAAGHEIASHGYNHELVYSLTPEAFRADVARSRALLEQISGRPVKGYRAPCFSITEWAIDILHDEGYTYDSSMMPTIAHDRYGRLDGIDARHAIVELREGFTEVCVSCISLGGKGIPWGGGGYFRLSPFSLWMKVIASIRVAGLPYFFYIHPWEIDPDHPCPGGIGAVNRFRQRINQSRCEQRFVALANAFKWTTIGDLIKIWGEGEPKRLPSEIATRRTIFTSGRTKR